ncbi:MAG TPA: ABC transporter ATP-binding protein, partial [Candidatus Polarisedimenticolia bacterium]|nr:ABC transporter ATP-binding protein [Candidatus Polarisedimenticolia bacterium]
TERLTVRYGRRTVVDEVSLRVPQGSVYALLGRNGAGKTSLVRCLLGLRRPEGGSVRVLEKDVWRERRHVMCETGFVPEDADGSPLATPAELARFCSRLYPRWDADAVHERLRRLGIPEGLRFGNLSKGQKKLVSLALALGHSPRLLVLDDPTLGLDLPARRAFYEELVGELADRKTTVLLTTHDLTGVEGVADRVGILVDGKLAIDDTMESLKARHATSAALEEIFLEVTSQRSEVA